MLAYKVREEQRLQRLADFKAVAEEEARIKKQLKQQKKKKRILHEGSDKDNDEKEREWGARTRLVKFVKMKNEANAF